MIRRDSGLSGGRRWPEGGQEAGQEVPSVGLISPWDPPAPARTARSVGAMCTECWGGPESVRPRPGVPWQTGTLLSVLAGCLDGFSEATALPRTRPTFLWGEAHWFVWPTHSGLRRFDCGQYCPRPCPPIGPVTPNLVELRGQNLYPRRLPGRTEEAGPRTGKAHRGTALPSGWAGGGGCEGSEGLALPLLWLWGHDSTQGPCHMRTPSWYYLDADYSGVPSSPCLTNCQLLYREEFPEFSPVLFRTGVLPGEPGRKETLVVRDGHMQCLHLFPPWPHCGCVLLPFLFFFLKERASHSF